jgi:DNA-binding transcriptional ArsR family regulator
MLYLTKRLIDKERDTMGLQHTMKALSDPIRREILTLLKAGRLSAGEIGEKFPISGAAVSKHLAVLKEADLIRDAREGKYIFYELNASVLEEVMLWLVGLKGEAK